MTTPRKRSIRTALSMREKILDLYDYGIQKGAHCGFQGVNLHFSRQRLAIISGIPGSGKSNLLDNFLLNTAASSGWHWLIYSPENFPQERHFMNFAEKICGASFLGLSNMHSRIPRYEVEELIELFDRHFSFVELPAGAGASIVNVVAAANAIIAERRAAGADTHGVVIDPWNELEHSRQQFEASKGMSETEFVSYALSYLKEWSHTANLFVGLVVHPTKLARLQAQGPKKGEAAPDPNANPYPVPSPYDAAGSAHFRNKADLFFTVHLPFIAGPRSDEVELHVQKVRFREDAKRGVYDLLFNEATTAYRCVPAGGGKCVDISLAAFRPPPPAPPTQEEIPF